MSWCRFVIGNPYLVLSKPFRLYLRAMGGQRYWVRFLRSLLIRLSLFTRSFPLAIAASFWTVLIAAGGPLSYLQWCGLIQVHGGVPAADSVVYHGGAIQIPNVAPFDVAVNGCQIVGVQGGVLGLELGLGWRKALGS